MKYLFFKPQKYFHATLNSHAFCQPHITKHAHMKNIHRHLLTGFINIFPIRCLLTFQNTQKIFFISANILFLSGNKFNIMMLNSQKDRRKIKALKELFKNVPVEECRKNLEITFNIICLTEVLVDDGSSNDWIFRLNVSEE